MTHGRGAGVVVVGGAATDYVVRVPALPTAERPATGDRFLRAPGGKGFNQAIAAASCPRRRRPSTSMQAGRKQTVAVRLEIPLLTVAHVIRTAHAAGARVVLDADPPAHAAAALATTELGAYPSILRLEPVTDSAILERTVQR